MTEHELCKDCQWNEYPVCDGTIMWDGLEMNIENLRPIFRCGQKNREIITDLSTIKKTKLEAKEVK